MMIRKIARKLHLWLSIPFGIIITIICLSGAILVFEKDINELIYKDRYFVKDTRNAPLPIIDIVDKVNKQLTNQTVTSIQILSQADRNYIVGLSGEGRMTAYVNPYTGDLMHIEKRGDGFFGKVMQLHRWLLDSTRKVGKPVVGYTTILFVVILITGMFIWWPKNKKQLKNRSQVTAKYGLRRFWADMHISVGMYVFIGLLVLSLTGLTYSFSWYKNGFYSLLGVETSNSGHSNTNSKSNKKENGDKPKEENKTAKGENKSKQKELDLAKWQVVYEQLKKENPTYKTIAIQDGTASVTQTYTFGNMRASDKYKFDNNTGAIISQELYKDQPRDTKVRGWVYSLHVGGWGGMFSKILTCLVALIGASLPLTGYYIYIIKLKNKRKKKQNTL